MRATVECADTCVPFESEVKYYKNGFLCLVLDVEENGPVIEEKTNLRIRIFDFDNKLTIYHGLLFDLEQKEWIIYCVEKWSIWERREFYRQNVSINAKLRYIQKENGLKLYNENICTILDISGGGLRFSCKECTLTTGAEVLIEGIKLIENDTPFSLECKIVRVDKNDVNNFFSCVFVNISEKKQEKLIEKIFKIQRTIPR